LMQLRARGSLKKAFFGGQMAFLKLVL